jgi:acyl-CoA reductase-like NAD-dependent aldehyde dehydrogenase
VLTRGRKLDPATWTQGFFMLPSMVLGAKESDEIVRCEQFGPVVPIIRFSDEADAITRANNSEFGLRASVWTADRDRAAAIADQLEAGAVFHNNHGILAGNRWWRAWIIMRTATRLRIERDFSDGWGP